MESLFSDYEAETPSGLSGAQPGCVVVVDVYVEE